MFGPLNNPNGLYCLRAQSTDKCMHPRVTLHSEEVCVYNMFIYTYIIYIYIFIFIWAVTTQTTITLSNISANKINLFK